MKAISFQQSECERFTIGADEIDTNKYQKIIIFDTSMKWRMIVEWFFRKRSKNSNAMREKKLKVMTNKALYSLFWTMLGGHEALQ